VAELFDFGTGGYDLHFAVPALSVGQYIQSESDSAFTQRDTLLAAPRGKVRITQGVGSLVFALYDSYGTILDRAEYEYSGAAFRARVTVYNESVTIFVDGWWGVTFWVGRVQHAEKSTVWLSGSSGVTITDVTLVELGDCRERIEADIDNSAANALSAVVGQRPLKMWSRYDGVLCVCYDKPRETIAVNRLTRVDREKSAQGASDMLVFADNTSILIDLEALEHTGFVTRSLRASDMGHGAITAGRKLQEEWLQDRVRYTLAGRIIPHLEEFDVIEMGVVLGGDAEYLEDQVVVVDFRLSVAAGEAATEIRGRQETPA